MPALRSARKTSETKETYTQESVIAMQRQVVEMQDSASILVKLSLRTSKGLVEIDPVKFTLDHPDDGTKAHYGLDSSEIAEDEQSLCISMAIDLRDGYSRDIEMEKVSYEMLDSDKITTIKKSKRHSIHEMLEDSLDALSAAEQQMLGKSKKEILDEDLNEETRIAEEMATKKEKDKKEAEAKKKKEADEKKKKDEAEKKKKEEEKKKKEGDEQKRKDEAEKKKNEDEKKKKEVDEQKKKEIEKKAEEEKKKKATDEKKKKDEEAKKKKEEKEKKEADKKAKKKAEEDAEAKKKLEQGQQKTGAGEQSMESFVHVECKEYKKNGSCNHLNDLVSFMSTKPSARHAKKKIDDAQLEEFHHNACDIFKKYGVCNHLEKLLYSILEGEIEITDIKVDGGIPGLQVSEEKIESERVNNLKSQKTVDEDDDLRFEDFVHKGCKEYKKHGACNHLNEIFIYVASNPTERELSDYIDNAKIGDYHHSGCSIFIENGKCNHLKEIIMSIRAGDIEIEGIEVDGKRSVPPKRVVEEGIDAIDAGVEESAIDPEAADVSAAADEMIYKREAEKKAKKEAKEKAKIEENAAKEKARLEEEYKKKKDESKKKEDKEDEERNQKLEEQKKRRIKEAEEQEKKDAEAEATRRKKIDELKAKREKVRLEEEEAKAKEEDALQAKKDAEETAKQKEKADLLQKAEEMARGKEQERKLREQIKQNEADENETTQRTKDKDEQLRRAAHEKALGIAAERAREAERVNQSGFLDYKLNFVDDETAQKRGWDRDVGEFCPEFCKDFGKFGTCEHVDQVGLNDLKNADDIRAAILEIPDTEEEISDEKLAETFKALLKNEESDTCDHLITIALRVKRKKVAEKKEIDNAEKVAMDFSTKKWDRDVKEKCPEFCREFDKYGTCKHVDKVSLDDYTHPGCFEYEQNNTCSHLREAMANISDNEGDDAEDALKDAMSEFKHYDCQMDKDHGHCDHLVTLALKVKKRKQEERKLIDQGMNCLIEECMDFTDHKNCNHIEFELLQNFKHLFCEEAKEKGECPCLMKLHDYVVKQNNHQNAVDIISALHLQNYEFIGPKSLEKNPYFTSIAQILKRVSEKVVRPLGKEKERVTCKEKCREYKITGTCEHIDEQLLDCFAHETCPEYKRTGRCHHLQEMVDKLRDQPSHADSTRTINAIHLDNWPHKAGLTRYEHPKSANVQKILLRMSRRTPRPKDEHGDVIKCTECTEFAERGLCKHVDEKLVQTFGHTPCAEFSEKGKCGHLYHTIQRIKLEPSHRLGAKLLNRLDLSDFTPKGGVPVNEHRDCYTLSKILMRISARWDRMLNKEPELPLVPQCPEHCLEFAKFMTCEHTYDRSLDEFHDSYGEKKPVRDAMINITEMGPETDDDVIRDLCFKFDHDNCKEFEETGKCLHLFNLAMRVRTRLHLQYDPERAKKAGEYCIYFCDESRLMGYCVHMDAKKLRKFGHKNCEDYRINGTCPCLIDLLAYCREDRYSEESLQVFRDRFYEFYHLGCIKFRKFGTCDHLDDMLQRAIERFDRDNNFDEWYHRGCDVYKAGEICEHMVESKLDEFAHRGCDDAKVYGKCFHSYEMIAQWKPEYDGFEYLRRTFPHEYDEFFHEKCEDYDKYGTCHHANELQFKSFSKKDGSSGAEEVQKFVYEFMMNDLKEEEEIEKWWQKEGKEKFSEYGHDKCAVHEVYGTCDHALDMLCEWKYKFDKKLRVLNRRDRKYEAYYHPVCHKFLAEGVCFHTADPKFEKYSHRNCLEYGRYGKCSHMRDNVLVWRAKYRDEYNPNSRANGFLRHEYRFRKEKEAELPSDADRFRERRERKDWNEEPDMPRRKYSEIFVDPNMDKMDNINETFKKLMARTYEIEQDLQTSVKPLITKTTALEGREREHRLQDIRDRVHLLLKRQDDISGKYARLGETEDFSLY